MVIKHSNNYTLYNKNNNIGNHSNDINNTLLIITVRLEEGRVYILSLVGVVVYWVVIEEPWELVDVVCWVLVWWVVVVVEDVVIEAVDEVVDVFVATMGAISSISKGFGVINGALFGRILYCIAIALINDSALYDSV